MKLLYLLISSILYVLSFSPFDYKLSIFFSLILLFYVLDGLSVRDKVKSILYFSVAFHLIGVSWISHSLLNFGSLGYLLSYTTTFIVALIISLPYAVVGLHQSVSKNGFLNLFFISSLFVVAEYLKSVMFGGFPWLLIGHSQNSTVFDFVYPFFGSLTVSYLVVLVSLFSYMAIVHSRKPYILLSIVSLLLIPLTYKDHNFFDETETNYLSFILYQPNIYPNDSYDRSKHFALMEKYNNILIKNKSSDLVIFPETIISEPYDKNNMLYKYFQSSKNKDNLLISGLFSSEKNHYYNSMIFFSDVTQTYNKRKLVPFGEYTPWYNSLLKLSENLKIPLSNLSHGSKEIDKISFGDVNLIPMICFESTFPHLIESSADNEIIINISNDGWFGNTLAPYQHLQITQIRALEFNRYILRATNTGISAVINNQGRVVDMLENNVEGTLKGQIPTTMRRSFYSEYGDLPVLMLIFFSLLIKGFNIVTKYHE